MTTIQTILEKYRPLLASLDVELLLANELKKSREFVLAHPEIELTKKQETNYKQLIARRLKHEPLAYILGHKEFYGLNFLVTRDTLIPRPETEMLVEKTLQVITKIKTVHINIIDVGTGSGNIIISIAKNLKKRKINYFGVDISKKALQVAKHNAKKNNLAKIKFLKSNLLNYYLEQTKTLKQASNLIILANLPYLSKEIYSATLPTVKNFEPKSALYSPASGLAHYEKLLKQIKLLSTKYKIPTTILEISPEQKPALKLLVLKYLPSARIDFQRDLAGKWRICEINLD
jgi:release factor glutamine methyltransferase